MLCGSLRREMEIRKLSFVALMELEPAEHQHLHHYSNSRLLEVKGFSSGESCASITNEDSESNSTMYEVLRLEQWLIKLRMSG